MKISARILIGISSLLATLFIFPLSLVYAQVPITDLGSLGGNYGVARGINDNGQVVGAGSLSNEGGTGFLWNNGSMTDLTSGAAAPWEINNSGYITGQDNGDGGFIWHNGIVTTIDSNILGGNYAVALDINSNNKVMGVGNNGNGELWYTPKSGS
jgi:probable HAF family extracellular repeat protein